MGSTRVIRLFRPLLMLVKVVLSELILVVRVAKSLLAVLARG